jgi:uncharacterized protein HemY
LINCTINVAAILIAAMISASLIFSLRTVCSRSEKARSWRAQKSRPGRLEMQQLVSAVAVKISLSKYETSRYGAC